MNRLIYMEHIGTHFDAALHFSTDGLSVDAIPVEALMRLLVVIDVTERTISDPDYSLMPEEVVMHERTHGRISPGACVALRSGWDARAVDHLSRETISGIADGVRCHPVSLARQLRSGQG